MPRHTLYAYVDGSDLRDVADAIERDLDAFVQSRTWKYGKAWVVNHRYPLEGTMKEGDLPDWDLGLNLELPDFQNEPQGWFSDVEALAHFLTELSSKSNREFVIGIGDSQTDIAEDLTNIGPRGIDLGVLRAIIGVSETA